MKQRLAFSYVSSPVRFDDTDLTSVSYMSPKLRFPKALKEPISTRSQTRQIKTRSVKHSREPSLDISTPSKLAVNKNSRLSQDLRESLENLSVEQDWKNSHESSNQKLSDLLRIVREFIVTSEKVVERLGAPSLAKTEINVILKKYKSYQRTLEDNITKMEKELLGAPKQQKAWLEKLAYDEFGLKEDPSQYGYLSSAFGTGEKMDFFETTRNQPQQEETTDRLLGAKKVMKGLQDGDNTLMKKVMSPSKSNTVLEGVNATYSKNQKFYDKIDINTLKAQYASLFEESKKKENEFRRMISEMEVLKNEKALMLSECKKANYMLESQKTAHEETRRALTEAQSNALVIRDAFNAKINALQNLVQNAFKGIEMFETDVHKTRKNDSSVGSLYSKMKEVEKNISEALKDQIPTQKTKNFDLKNQELECIKEEHESSSCHTESYTEDKRTPQQRADALKKAEKELYETKKKLQRAEKLLEEKERVYKQSNTQYVQPEQSGLEDDGLTHADAFERNLDLIMNKLEDRERDLYNKAKTYNQSQRSFEEMKRENEISLSEVDSALKRCLDITTQAKKKVSEITITGSEVKSWLEKENEMLREGLTNVLEKVKQLNRESETLRETLDLSLTKIGNVVKDLEEKIVEIEREAGEEEIQKEKILLKETIRKTVEWLKGVLVLRSPRNQDKTSLKGENKNTGIQDVLELCEWYISKLEAEKDRKIGGSAKKGNNDSEDSVEDVLEAKNREYASDDEIKTIKKQTMEKYKVKLQGASKVNDNKQKNTEKKFQKIWKELALSRGKGQK